MTVFTGCNRKINVSLPEKDEYETYHGVQVIDSYRYVENVEDTIVQEWISYKTHEAENYFDNIGKTKHLTYLLRNWKSNDKPVVSKLKISDNDYQFYLKRSANEDVGVLYYKISKEKKEELLYDPKLYKKDDEVNYVINYIQPNSDGSKVVVSLTSEGKEVSELIIIDVATKKVASEILTNAWPSNTGGIQWLPDNSGFIFLRYPVINPKDPLFLKNTQSVLYRLGTNSEDLEIVLSNQNNPDLHIKEEDFPAISIEGEYLIGKMKGAYSYYDAFYLPVKKIKSKDWKPLFKKSDQVKSFWVVGDSIYYRTAKNAPNFKICKTSVKQPNFKNPKILVEEFGDQVITDFDVTSEGLYYVTTKNGIKASLYKLQGGRTDEVILPETYGNINIAAKGKNYPDLWISANGWITDSKLFLYKNGEITEQNLNSSTTNPELTNDLVVQEIEVIAHDGEKIPLSLIHHKDTKLNGKNRVLMDGYGSYGIPMKPTFMFHRLLWILEGGVYAIAHVRGGGEKGDAWHKGGYKDTKPNTWKDFISCAEYLIAQKYTNPDQLAIWSGSAGGIMIGRAITERPDLFNAAIVEFGSLNMLRSEFRPNGANNVKEFGSIRDSIGFRNLLEMDAYHHINDKEAYPATLLTVGLNDPRVPAWFSVKFTAKIEKANTSEHPNLLLANSESGHGQDDTKLVEFERYANILAFALWQTGHPDYQPK